MTGWLYVSEKERFDRGIEIGDTLGLNLSTLFTTSGEKLKIDGADVCRMATELYYDPEMKPPATLHKAMKLIILFLKDTK